MQTPEKQISNEVDYTLAKQVTQLETFEWQVGMYWRKVGTQGSTHVDPATAFMLSFKAWKAEAELDLDHDANTGFLIRMLLGAYECGMSVVPHTLKDKPRIHIGWLLETFDHEGNPDEFKPEGGEHINYLLARALVEAS